METLYDIALEWTKKQPALFTSEDFKKYYQEHCVIEKQNQLGQVFGRLSANGEIFRRGSKASTNKSAKGRQISLWVSKKTHEIKSRNRRANGYTQTELL